MTVSGVPTTKADVTDFTAVAARGGLMSIPNKQRKRYARGPNEFEVETMDEEIITPYDLQMEEGVNIGEQVKYNTGNPRQGAWNVWNSGGINQEIYDFDFEIFFDSGDWSDHLRGQVDVEENTQMASGPDLSDSRNELAIQLFGKELKLLSEEEINILDDEAQRQMQKFGVANGGIIGLRHGGRPGYNIGEIVTADTEAVTSEVPQSQKNQIEGNQMAENAINEIILEFYRKFPEASEEDIQQMVRNYIAEEQFEGVLGNKDLGILGLDKAARMITPERVTKDEQRIARGDTQWGDLSYAQGGRPGYAESNAKDFAEIDMTISDNPNDPRNMTTVEIISVIKSGRSTPEMFEELRLRGIKDVDLVDLAEFGKDAGEGDVAYSFNERMLDKYDPDQRGAQEGFLYDLRENNPDVYGEYKEPKNYPEQNFYLAEPTWMKAQGGRIKKDNGGIMNLGGLEKDYRTTGGFVPIGEYEKKDDVPARLSKNEFVMTADAVRAAGGGSINKGAQRMYDTMKHLEASPQAKRMTA